MTLQDAILILFEDASSDGRNLGEPRAAIGLPRISLELTVVSGVLPLILDQSNIDSRFSNFAYPLIAILKMGRTRTKAKKSVSAVTNSSQSSSSSAAPAISALLDKAQELIVQCDFPLARKFIDRALVRDDGSVSEKNQAKEMMGVVLLETGEVDEAREASRCYLLTWVIHLIIYLPLVVLIITPATSNSSYTSATFSASLSCTTLCGSVHCFETLSGSHRHPSDTTQRQGTFARPGG